MIEWYSQFDTTMQFYWGCAIVGSAIFLIQALLTLMGMDHDIDMDADIDLGAGDTMDMGRWTLIVLYPQYSQLHRRTWVGAVYVFRVSLPINFCSV